MKNNNITKQGCPFTLMYGKQPNTMINRFEDVNLVLSRFCGDNPVRQTYLIEGVRGSGKTVLMTTIASALKADGNWEVVDLSMSDDLLESLAARLCDITDVSKKILDRGGSISVGGFGIGINPSYYSPDSISIITRCLEHLKKKKKRLLITIDEVVPGDNMRKFASQFQIFVREDFPVFTIMTGLYHNIYDIQNDPILTFLLRTPKIRTEPLRTLQMTNQYASIFNLDKSQAKELADFTKGYAFAFQALGLICWESGSCNLTQTVTEEFDALLDDYMYKKIWESLTRTERRIVLQIPHDNMENQVVYNAAQVSKNSFSQYKDKLIKKGVLCNPEHGRVSLVLPRFYEIVSQYE